MNVVLVSGDLMGMSRVDGAARQVGAVLRLLPTVDAAVETCTNQPVALVLVDLATPRVDIGALVNRLRDGSLENPPRVVAFGPHVHESALAAAAAAGCDLVLSRGAFMAQIEAILVKFAAVG